jgi:hypothetical protein
MANLFFGEAKLATANKAVADAKLKQSNANNEVIAAEKNLQNVKSEEATRLANKQAKKLGSSSPVYSSDEEFLDSYLRKVDAIMGSPESFRYLEEIKKRVEENEQGMGKRP